MGEHMCTRMDKVLAVNFDPFGACACCNGSPCTAPVIDWTHVTDKIRLGGNLLLLENSELLCSLGGRIRIFYTLAAASAACGASREEERSFWSKAIDFGKGLGKGLWKGLKGTVTGVIDLGIWAGKHSLPYMLLDPAGFADQLKQDGEILKSLGNLAGKAGTWMYRNSAVNLLANPQDFLAAQQENRAMLETLADKAANMSAEEWGDFAGQVLFEVGTEVATAGGAAALTAVKAADKVVDVAKAANRVDDVLDAAKALDKIDDAADIAKAADKLDDAADAAKALDKAKVLRQEIPVKNTKLVPGTLEHKTARWEAYKKRGGKWDYDRWSKQYDTNMQNAKYGLAREKAYRTQLGGCSETVKTPFTNRQIDIHKPDEMYAGQLKTGKMSLTKQAKIDIQKDAAMVQQGYKVEYILEKGASQPFLDALKANGIDYHIGPKIP